VCDAEAGFSVELAAPAHCLRTLGSAFLLSATQSFTSEFPMRTFSSLPCIFSAMRKRLDVVSTT